MSHELSTPDALRADLATFGNFLPGRRPIPGEEDGGFEAFRDALKESLAPLTPYEAAIAENLVRIEWDIVQLRRAQDLRVTRAISNAVADLYVVRGRERHEASLDAAFDEFSAEGGRDRDWSDPVAFDEGAAREAGFELARRACSSNPDTKWGAVMEIAEMGLDLADVMSAAYDAQVGKHADGALAILEQRRRHVMRDYETLQSRRPIDASRLDA